ncbi:hypothetical protein LTR86_010481 [Recurvomyces mirabilis]|nr:hypothetical protein LTR86_010481 [Recurvomyces mirabilis]
MGNGKFEFNIQLADPMNFSRPINVIRADSPDIKNPMTMATALPLEASGLHV